jgi:hypothetical protein
MDEWLEVVLPVGTFVLGALLSTWQHHTADNRALRRQEAADRYLATRLDVSRAQDLAANQREVEAARKTAPIAELTPHQGEAAVAVFAFDRETLAALQSALLDLHEAVLARLGTSGAQARTATVLDDLRLLNQVRMLASRTTDEESRRATTRYAQLAEATLTAPGHDGGATVTAFQRAYLKATTSLGDALTGHLHDL